MTIYDPNATGEPWDLRNVGGRHLDEEEFEEFKTKFYTYGGWDPTTGRPTPGNLATLGMAEVADTLEYWGKLGGGVIPLVGKIKTARDDAVE